ncbi:MAG: antibiotic biosynthesis monooxygenase [Hyphomicrobiales bacterium]|nr:antibiotic biosynthesis monooxygenase [Hyphomicrobiales bacterium]
MSGSVHWVREGDIKEGKLDAFKELMAEMVEAARAEEPDTLNYEWFLSDDGQRCQISERYKDSAAAMAHLASFGRRFAERFMAVLTPTRMVVFGDPDDAVRGALSGFDPAYYTLIGGFAR